MKLRTSLAAGLAVLATALPGPAASAAGSDQQVLANNYASLSGAMLNLYASQSHQDLGTYLAGQKLLLVPSKLPNPLADGSFGAGLPASTDPSLDPSAAPSLDPGAAPSLDPTAAGAAGLGFETLDVAALSASGGLLLTPAQAAQVGGGTRISATDIGSLDRQLARAGVSLDTHGFKSLSQLASAVTRSARTPDGAVTLAGAQWAQDLADIRIPALASPSVGTPRAPGVPADALPFGLLMNRSLTNLVTNYPNLVSAAQKNGLGQPGMVAAWNKSMAAAYAQSSGDLSAMLPNACVGDIMAVMASGSAGSAKNVRNGSCSSSCLAAGQYLHNSAAALFNPQAGSLSPNITNPAGGVLNSSSMNNMATWAQTLIGGQNAQLSGSPFDALSGDGGSCAAASQGARSTMKATLPGVFAGLSH